MKLKNIIVKTVKMLPGCSLFAYTEKQLEKLPEERDSMAKWGAKVIGHVAYATVFSFYIFSGITADIWTPNQYSQAREKFKTTQLQQTEYDQKLFGEKGYVDKDKNGTINLSERFEFYKRAGLESKIIFQNYNLENLERAIKSYEADSQ